MHTTRRAFLAGTTSLLAGSLAGEGLAAAGRGGTTALERVQSFGQGASRCEGVAIDAAGFVYGAGGKGELYKVDPAGQVTVLCNLPAGATPSGLTFDRQGNVICCDAGTRSILRIAPSGQIGVLADHAGGVPLVAPNFPSYDAEGNLFVSNSTNDHDGRIKNGEFMRPLPNGVLLRIRPNETSEIVASGLCWANGTAIDPAEEAVYVLESTKRDCLRIPLRKNGTFGKPELFAKDFPGMPDGMAFAEDGTLFVTVPLKMGPDFTVLNQVLKVEKDGSWSVFLSDPESGKMRYPTNCAFGGPDRRDLFIANSQGEHFSRVRTNHVGHRLYHQR